MNHLFSRPPLVAKITFILLAAFWVALAFLSLGRVNGGDLARTIRYAIYAFFMLTGGALALLFAFRLETKSKRVYQSALALITLGPILTGFAGVGAAEIPFIILNVFALYALYVYSDEFTEYAE